MTDRDERRTATQRAKIRGHLQTILALQDRLTHAAHLASYKGEHEDGPPLGGEAMTHLGPQNPYADDPCDPTPAVELIWLEHTTRHHLGHQPLDRPTLETAVEYLTDHLNDLNPAAIDHLEHRTQTMRTRIEDTVHAGLRDVHGVPCLHCGHTLLRRMHPHTGLADHWECTGCKRTLTHAEYWQAVREDYIHHAQALPADLLGPKLGVSANLVRVWGARGRIRKRGRSTTGTTLYDVEDAQHCANDNNV